LFDPLRTLLDRGLEKNFLFVFFVNLNAVTVIASEGEAIQLVV